MHNTPLQPRHENTLLIRCEDPKCACQSDSKSVVEQPYRWDVHTTSRSLLHIPTDVDSRRT